MLTFQLLRARIAQSDIAKFDHVLADLDDVPTLVSPALEAQAKVLGVPPEELLGTDSSQDYLPPYENVRGEILTDGEEMVAVIIRTDRDNRIMVTDDGEHVVEEATQATLFCAVLSPSVDSLLLERVRDAVRETFGVELEVSAGTSRRFDELMDEGRVTVDKPTDAEVSAAEVLADPVSRKLAIAVKAGGGLLKKDLQSQVVHADQGRVEAATRALLDAGLLEADVVVVCGKSGGQVNRLPSPDLLQGLADSGLKCSCGRRIDEEKCEDAVSISQLGRDMLDGSRWMTVQLVVELERCGLPANRVLVDQQKGGDEMDCIADVYGSVLLLELKDKEFSLGNAYSFGAKMGIIRPDVPVIVTTEHVGGDAKTHFEERARSARRPRVARYREVETEPEVRYIEGMDELRGRLDEIVTELAQARSQKILGDTLALGSVSPAAVLRVVAERTRGTGAGSEPAT